MGGGNLQILSRERGGISLSWDLYLVVGGADEQPVVDGHLSFLASWIVLALRVVGHIHPQSAVSVDLSPMS